jgi:choline dehydrogenase-like flavoprotein
MSTRVVVIGSGLAGSLVCNALVGSADVTLLEKGAEHAVSFPPVEYVRREFAAVKTFCHGGGGTTNLWHNGLIPIRREDVASPEFRDLLAAAWPYADRAASRLFFPNERFSAEYARLVEEMGRLGDRLGVFTHGVDCLLYPKRFTKLTVDPRVTAHYSVEDIAFDHRDGRIAAVDCRVGAERHRIDADVVVVSAGALGTPLLVSRILEAAGQRDPRPGTGLIDHPLGFVGKVRFTREAAPTMHAFALSDRGDYDCCTAIRLKHDDYSAFAFMRPALTMQNSLSISKYKSLLGASSGMARVRHALSPRILHPDILAEIYAHLSGRHLPTRVFNVLVIFEQKRGRNAVMSGEHGLRVDWGIGDEEIAIYNEMLRGLQAMLLPIADEVNLQIPLSEAWLWSSAHHSGTMSVGRSDVDLLDSSLRLKRCSNVYVCDGSVIQEHSYANTGLTIGQLALRLSEELGGMSAV